MALLWRAISIWLLLNPLSNGYGRDFNGSGIKAIFSLLKLTTKLIYTITDSRLALTTKSNFSLVSTWSDYGRRTFYASHFFSWRIWELIRIGVHKARQHLFGSSDLLSTGSFLHLRAIDTDHRETLFSHQPASTYLVCVRPCILSCQFFPAFFWWPDSPTITFIVSRLWSAGSSITRGCTHQR